MVDLSQLSDEELEKIAGGGLRAQSSPTPAATDISKMSDEELNHIAMGGLRKPLPKPEPEKGFLRGLGESALETAVDVGNFIDSYTGAPTRAAIGAVQEGKNPLGAAYHQFGEDPSKAPTGKEIVTREGVDTTPLSEYVPSLYSETGDEWLKFKKGGLLDPSAAGTLGFGLDVVADPTNVIGAGAAKNILRGGAQAAKKGVTATGRGLKTAVELLPKGDKVVDAVQGIGKGLKKTGDVAQTAGQMTANVAKNTAKGIANVFSPKQAEDYAELVEIAKRHGVNPEKLSEGIEFGENSFISRGARALNEGPTGEASLIKHTEGVDEIQKAINNQIAKKAGGRTLAPIEAGSVIRSGLDGYVDRVFKTVDVTHNMVPKLMPGLELTNKSKAMVESALVGAQKHAAAMIERGVTKTQKVQAQQILTAVNGIRKSKNYKQLTEQLRVIGDAAFKSRNTYADIPPDIERLRDIYFRVNDALIDTVRTRGGKKMAEDLLSSNKALHEMFSNRSVLAPVVGSKALAPEQVFSALVLNGNSDRIKTLKKVLTPEEFNALKGSYLDQLVRRNIDGGFSFKKLGSTLQAEKHRLAQILDPQEVADLQELVRLGQRHGDSILSYSGTGASNSFRKIAENISDSSISRELIEMLKKRARNGGAIDDAVIPPPSAARQIGRTMENTIDEATGSVQKGVQKALPGVDNRMRLAGLGARSLAVQEHNTPPSPELLDAIERNPEYINKIKNPNLRRQVYDLLKKRREQHEVDTMMDILKPGN